MQTVLPLKSCKVITYCYKCLMTKLFCIIPKLRKINKKNLQGTGNTEKRLQGLDFKTEMENIFLLVPWQLKKEE